MQILALVLALAPAAVLGQGNLWDQCMLRHSCHLSPRPLNTPRLLTRLFPQVVAKVGVAPRPAFLVQAANT